MPAATVTIPDVPILRVGTWGGSNDGKAGPVIVTAEHLADMVAAAGDPDIDTAPLKLGHVGTLSDLGTDDSEPALGWVANHRLSDDGQTLVVDYVDVPAALEEPIKAGYKRRSAEIAWGVKTVAGKTYSAVIDALALLGVKKPAVKGLADLAELYGTATLATAGREVGAHSTLMLDVGEPSPQQRIQDQLVWARKAAAELGALVGLDGLPAVFAALEAMVPADSRGLLSQAPHHDPVTTATTPGGTMPKTFSAEEITRARGILGLDDKATDDQVVAKLSELGELVTEQKAPDGTGAGTGEGGTIPPAGDGTPAPEPAAASAALSAAAIEELKAAGLTVLPLTAVDELKAGAAAGVTAASTLAEQARTKVLDDAERAGKFGAGDNAKAIRSKLSEQLETNFEGTKALIDLMPPLVPVGELGTAHTGDQATSALAAAADAAFDQGINQLFAGELPAAPQEA